MDDALSMWFVQRIRDLDGAGQRLVERQRSSGQARRERLPIDELHHEKVDALVVGPTSWIVQMFG